MALSTARISVLRGRPPGLAGGINGSISCHWASVKSLGYPECSILRLYHPSDFPDRLSEPHLRRHIFAQTEPGRKLHVCDRLTVLQGASRNQSVPAGISRPPGSSL